MMLMWRKRMIHPPYDCEDCGKYHFAWSLHQKHRKKWWEFWK